MSLILNVHVDIFNGILCYLGRELNIFIGVNHINIKLTFIYTHRLHADLQGIFKYRQNKLNITIIQ